MTCVDSRCRELVSSHGARLVYVDCSREKVCIALVRVCGIENVSAQHLTNESLFEYEHVLFVQTM